MPRLAVVDANIASRPREEMNPVVPRPVMEDASSTGSIIAAMVVFTPVTVEFKMVVRPTEEMKLAVPRPVTVLVSSAGSIMDEILLLVPVTVLVRFARVRRGRPLMLDTMSSGAETVPDAVRRPVLSWRVEREVAMTSPMLMKPELEPMARESTTREEMYPWMAVTKAVEMDDWFVERMKLDVLDVKRVAVEMALDTLSARRFWK